MSFIDLQNNISNSNKTIGSLQNIFYNESINILNSKILEIPNHRIELTEVEFYFFECDKHSDPYVHVDNLQKNTSNYLYVHKQAWIRGGIDITFGNNNYFGGILIRGIKHNDDYISGSATVKKYLANLIDTSITNHISLQEYFEKNKLEIYLINNETKKNRILHSSRVGLNLYKDVNYANALYRFIREDYLNASKENLKSYNNLKERTKIKAISNLTLGYETNENKAIEDVISNKELFENIKLFKKIKEN